MTAILRKYDILYDLYRTYKSSTTHLHPKLYSKIGPITFILLDPLGVNKSEGQVLAGPQLYIDTKSV